MKKQMLIVIFLIMGFCSYIYSQVDLKSKEYDLGLMAGMWMGGTIWVDGFELDKDASMLFRGFVDAYLIPKLAMGAYFNFSPYSMEYADITIFEFGGSIKPRFFIKEDLALKPGINFGYRTASSDPEGFDMDGFGVNLSVEIQKALETMILSIEGGFLSQPVGGNEAWDISWAPIMYIGAGVTF